MKRILYSIALISTIYSCTSTKNIDTDKPQPTLVNIDLVNVEDDKVKVTVDPGKFNQDQISFRIPKTVPGTYSIDNYGEFIENLKAFDYLGKELLVAKTDENSWLIQNATNLDKITYLVNDSFDINGEKGVFSPAGTNIEKDENFMLNLHGFVGYFDGLQERPYQLMINRPKNLIAGTSLPISQTTQLNGKANVYVDTYNTARYFEVVDNPLMYSKPDTTYINVEGIKVLVSVYSPNKVYTSKDIKQGIQTMISAQKKYLGAIDNTSNYAILLYLANPEKVDAKGYGALEHHTSTVVVLPETMPLETLHKTMTDVVSHEFFHILTPLNVHSKEIHYFDYNSPKMSKHLWMYEGVTEYFAHHFQVNQGMINKQEFYDRMAEKIETSRNFNDSIPFTHMSQHILEEPYKDDYYNVYLKGALIGMALDIQLRDLSDGENGILDLMQKLSTEYGKDNPFNDDELISKIVSLTHPEIQTFFDTYVSGETPLAYNQIFDKVGLTMDQVEVETSFFINGQVPYIDGDPSTNNLFFRKNITLNSFLLDLGVENGDVIRSVNGTDYNIMNVYELIMKSQDWQVGEDISMVVERDGEQITINSKISQPTDKKIVIKEQDLPDDSSKVILRNIWLMQ